MSIGYPDSTHPGELERVLDDEVAAVLFRPGKHGNLLPLEEDHLPHRPRPRCAGDDRRGDVRALGSRGCRTSSAAGADLVAVSGGKGFRGPRASGLLGGTPEFIDVIAPSPGHGRGATWPRNTGEKTP